MPGAAKQIQEIETVFSFITLSLLGNFDPARSLLIFFPDYHL